MDPFKNREEAARLLVGKLTRYAGLRPLVLAIPRGAVPMGRIIADAIDGDLDVVIVHKLGAPDNPEFAVGSVDESGDVYISEDARALMIGDDYLNREARKQLAVLHRRRALYTPVRPPIDPSGRVVIVVDNGIATGATMIAALRAVRVKRPEQLIAAVAVAPPETLRRISREADDTICLEAPEEFYAVGQFYLDFPQVTDEEVIELLQRTPRPHRSPSRKVGTTRADAGQPQSGE
ncbi:MAG TPA: phosphoribosyltransferase family protein [Nitrospiria bacterium]|nr:phosphoribosyltransferase family protein [Nitrospiria bacterium]